MGFNSACKGLCNTGWQFFNNVLGQRIGPILCLAVKSSRRMLGTLRYAVYIQNGESGDWFSGNQSLNCLTLTDGTERSSQNAGKKPPFCDAQNPGRVLMSFTLRQKPKILEEC
jgi:hypothetical protein